MTVSLSAAAQTLAAARRLQAHRRLAQDACTLAWKALTALLIAGVLDLLWPWPAALRGCWMLGVGCWVFLSSGSGRSRLLPAGSPPPSDASLARAIEMQRPELDNALIHAVQFGPAAARSADLPETVFLRREMERAARMAARLPLRAVVDGRPLARARRALLAVALFLLLTVALFPRAWRFELPRFLAFWRDAPPFTLTDFAVTPGDARVSPGESLPITVRVGGLLPQRLEFITGQAGEPEQAVPLTAVDSGVYEARLEGLTRDTWYYVAADTGRSARYLARVVPRPPAPAVPSASQPPSGASASGSRPGQKQDTAQRAGGDAAAKQARRGRRTGGVSEQGGANAAARRVSAASAGALSRSPGEAAPEVSSTPPKATDREAARYPAAYRRLVRDYFRAVADGR